MNSATVACDTKDPTPPNCPAASAKRSVWGLGDNQIGQAKTREKHLAERPRIEHAIIVIQATERREGPAVVAKLTVVIVFYHPSIDLAGPVQQLQAARQ